MGYKTVRKIKQTDIIFKYHRIHHWDTHVDRKQIVVFFTSYESKAKKDKGVKGIDGVCKSVTINGESYDNVMYLGNIPLGVNDLDDHVRTKLYIEVAKTPEWEDAEEI